MKSIKRIIICIIMIVVVIKAIRIERYVIGNNFTYLIACFITGLAIGYVTIDILYKIKTKKQ